MEFEKVIKERFSVRKFQDREIEEEKLLKILEAGRIAPTAKNLQPQRVYVLKGKEKIAKLKDAAKMTFGAPVVLLVCADMDVACKISWDNGGTTAQTDASIAGCQMMLEAWNLGIGSVWVRYFNNEEVKSSFNLPDNIEVVCLLPLGYKDPTCVCSPLHNQKNTLEEMVHYL